MYLGHFSLAFRPEALANYTLTAPVHFDIEPVKVEQNEASTPPQYVSDLPP
ncbi:hypothetical protein ACRALDRAFT_2019085 [Sodiomyces alcalophilus JCM 7366]|uniref:uncharacterized protein n=1 Tax=Sodiomyces alcalophilus JCM 7366 TaxID=591952 RepID=UPI0039B4F314